MNHSKWLYVRRPETDLTPDCYRRVDEPLDTHLSRNEVLLEAQYWSVDPYMRIQQSAGDTWEKPFPLNTVQGGAVVARVLEVAPDVTDLETGDWVETYMGWQTHAIRSLTECRRLDPELAPPSTALHVLGMPGRIAYFGLFEANFFVDLF